MNFKGIEICCPACHGELAPVADDSLSCQQCSRKYPVLLGIPDLRLEPDPYIGFAEERAKVEKLAARFDELDFESFVDFYYSITSVVPPKHAQQYKRSLMAGVPRAQGWLAQWERMAACALPGGALLDIGCGTGPLLVAARNYRLRAGVDIALRWLVVAKKRLQQEKLDLPLFCACAEALPFAKPQFDRVVLDSTIEHVRSSTVTLRQAYGVIPAGGALFLATPNRRSVGPDPHTGILCGSFLPELWTAALVRRSGGIPPKRKLLVPAEVRSLLEREGFAEVRMALPEIAAGQQAHFSGWLKLAIGAYELARRLPISKQVLAAVGPLLLATARKSP